MQPKVFNSSNRGVPDLVSMSDAFIIIQHGAEVRSIALVTRIRACPSSACMKLQASRVVPANQHFWRETREQLVALRLFRTLSDQAFAQTFVGGTSAACPVVAGMIGLINDARHAAGRPTLGFLNPFLYANPECFQDITGGKNLYGATKGWDPASGLGTPIFACLLKAAMSSPAGDKREDERGWARELEEAAVV